MRFSLILLALLLVVGMVVWPVVAIEVAIYPYTDAKTVKVSPHTGPTITSSRIRIVMAYVPFILIAQPSPHRIVASRF